MGLRPVAGAYHKDEKQMAELHARISQETFDEAVQETTIKAQKAVKKVRSSR